ncbi:MAG TPA: GTPase ObgE [Anaeromyxobacteraceae bacterium]|nr:GTPase ObgE [Anaeromyxobacteraceae bacterium]
MKFVDEVRIHVKAGDGGDGAVAWRREKFVPRGGPAGGDGGHGGDVVLAVDPQLGTLLDYRYVREHRARNGEHGRGSDQNGQDGPILELRVPPGTVVKDALSGEVLADLAEPGQRLVAARGGRGGLGNMNFATSTNQAPRYAEKGTAGEERELLLELKLLADVGIVGWPNAGKSTLISRISRARPKIADYPFTTLAPNLGVVSWRGQRSFVVADIPGLIEGAHAGAGLGLQFLRHVERCRVLVHLVDPVAPGEGRSPARDLAALNRELALYSAELARKPQVVAVTKLDLPEAREGLAEFRRSFARRKRKPEILGISSATGEGLDALLDAVAGILYGAEARPHARKRVGKPRARKATAP